MTNETTWATRVKALRESGLTLTEIGQLVGLTTSAVCDLEQGRTRRPNADTGLKLDRLYQRRRSVKAAVDRAERSA